MWIAKIAIALLAVLVAVTFTDKVSVIAPGNTQLSQGLLMPWQLQIGWVIMIAILIVWWAVAFGVAWAVVGSLKIDDKLNYDCEHRYWRINVSNRGILDAEADAVMDIQIGRNPQMASWRMVDLTWTDYPSTDQAVRPAIPPGESARSVDLFKVVGTDLVIPGRKYEQKVAEVNQKEKTWVRLGVRGVNPRSAQVLKWFSIVYVENQSPPYVVSCETPPLAMRGGLFHLQAFVEKLVVALPIAIILRNLEIAKKQNAKKATARLPK